MIALSTFVVQASPQQKLYSGWSETSETRRHPRDGRQAVLPDVPDQIVHREAVLRPPFRVPAHV